MEQWVHLESQVAVENQVPLVTLAHLVTRETWEWKELKVVLDFKDQEGNLESQVHLDLLEKLDQLESQEKMVIKEVKDHLDLLGFQDYQVLEETLDKQEALVHWELKDYL